MAKAINGDKNHRRDYHVASHDMSHDMGLSGWQTKISNHIAYALLAYTGLQIFVVMGAIGGHGMSMLPYLALVVLVAIVIPLARKLEKQWDRFLGTEPSAHEISRRYNFDRIKIWVFALGFPFLIVGLSKLVSG